MPAASLLLAWLTVASPPPQAPAAPPKSVYALEDDAFVAQAQEDLRQLERYAQGLRRLSEEVKTSRALYLQKQSEPYTPDQKQRLLTTWAAFFDYFVSTEVIRQRYWDFVKEPLLTQPKKHAWGFLLTHGALTTELAHGLTFAELTGGRKQLEVLLDEPAPEYGLPARAFARFKEKVIHVGTTTQLLTGDGYKQQLRPLLVKAGALDAPRVPWVMQEMKLNSEVAKGLLIKRGPVLFAKAATDLTQDSAQRAFFPVQRAVAEWMGDTRVHRSGQPLISRAQVQALLERMEPGDILVARQNWYLSNIGLPGFWPHAELYVGTQQELAAYFDEDKDVKAWLATLEGKPQSFTGHLATAFPTKWAAYNQTDTHGDALRIIESISEGVSFTGPEHGMRVDYLGVMRPRLTRVDKARAILRAFGYQGRPYDFDFDFFSDQTLVCTELVWKSYAPSKELRGLSIPLVDVVGRRTLPANELVRLFDAEFGREDRQLDFVAFLDGREGEGLAKEADAAAFRYSYRRAKWDIAQE
ncbi:protein tyrosine phosphatase [Myxococcus sp. XM-1-1-1]|uniref:YiiX/YebB-like N1pC/P60 family cysteine hydrolase n=1 Tax=Myxococcus sp. XM-1-1-1 TaxID=2874602 RepID=UPI001CBCF33F|nr:YiiX/YebB-like N1pC/P60 family cysteine hydrolase [Myxococcus sp. XM-1-1-1]MBZ4412887.1 protein tyrosine phosphatase [Myxococcus sp. XM-1-1-1]BDT32701.1 YiiX/YebB-like N1pC/P60 family cysteine hydrolase [Myxococcus sp. MH1]